MSFRDLHLINNRALPSQILLYKHAITLHRLISNEIPTFEWLALHFNLISSCFKLLKNFIYVNLVFMDENKRFYLSLSNKPSPGLNR